MEITPKEFEQANAFDKIDSIADTSKEILKYQYYDYLLKICWENRQQCYDFEPIFVYIALFCVGLLANCCLRSRVDYKIFSCRGLILIILEWYASMIVCFAIIAFISVFFVSSEFEIWKSNMFLIC